MEIGSNKKDVFTGKRKQGDIRVTRSKNRSKHAVTPKAAACFVASKDMEISWLIQLFSLISVAADHPVQQTEQCRGLRILCCAPAQCFQPIHGSLA